MFVIKRLAPVLSFFVPVVYGKLAVTFLSVVPYGMEHIIPMVNLTFRETQERYPHIDFQLYTIHNPLEISNNCTLFEQHILEELGRFYRNEVDRGRYVVILPTGCTNALAVIGDFGREINVPVIASAGVGIVLQNKVRFPTLVRILPTRNEALALCMLQMFRVYRWRTVTLLCDTISADTSVKGVCQEQRDLLLSNKYGRTYDMYASGWNLSDHTQQRAALLQAGEQSRVIILQADPKKIMDILQMAASLGMVYVMSTSYRFEWDIPSLMKHIRDASYDDIYRSFLTMSLAPISEGKDKLDSFAALMAARNTPFSEISYWIVTCAHDALTSAAEIVNETLAQGLDMADGVQFARRMYNRTFPSLLKQPVAVGPNGDSSSVYAVFGLTAETKKFETLWKYNAFTDSLTPTKNQWIRDNDPPLDKPACGYFGDGCKPSYVKELLPKILPPCVLMVACTLGLYFWHRRYLSIRRARSWIIPLEDLKPPSASQAKVQRAASNLTVFPATANAGGLSYGSVKESWQNTLLKRNPMQWYGMLLGRCGCEEMRNSTHDNVALFYGICICPVDIIWVSEYCPEHSLQDLLHSESAESLLRDIRLSFFDGITSGMKHMHNSIVKYHGQFSASNCLLDRRLTVRLSDFGPHEIRSQCVALGGSTTLQQAKLLYKAPEVLRSPDEKLRFKSADVYAFAIVMHQLLFVCDPFWTNLRERNAMVLYSQIHEIVSLVQAPLAVPYRPSYKVITSGEQQMSTLLESCWAEDPLRRPSFGVIRRYFRDKFTEFTGHSAVENILFRLEVFTQDLERQVMQKTVILQAERKLSDKLLAEIFPKSVVEILRAGEQVIPEPFDQVTIGFTALTDFNTIVKRIEPFIVVEFLHQLFYVIDESLSGYDVYKVETIADTCLIASGVPYLNGFSHSAEMGTMALKIMERTASPIELSSITCRLQLKLGLSTGSCAAGVMGTHRQRFCLFGDTVNTASRMTSFGEGRKIHVSDSYAAHVDRHWPGVFSLAPRGLLTVKGKGEMATFWLEGRMDGAQQEISTALAVTSGSLASLFPDS